MKTIKLSSSDLREMVAKRLGREVSEVEENCKDDGFMATWFDGGHDSVPLYIPLVRFLCAFYDPHRWKQATLLNAGCLPYVSNSSLTTP